MLKMRARCNQKYAALAILPYTGIRINGPVASQDTGLFSLLPTQDNLQDLLFARCCSPFVVFSLSLSLALALSLSLSHTVYVCCLLLRTSQGKPFVDKGTLQKVHVVKESETAEALLRYIPAEHVPKADATASEDQETPSTRAEVLLGARIIANITVPYNNLIYLKYIPQHESGNYRGPYVTHARFSR